MISLARATGAELEVLRSALDYYLTGINKAMIEAREESVRDDAIWRRHVIAELMAQIADR